jgi:disulfide bond formation protein DsbB
MTFAPLPYPSKVGLMAGVASGALLGGAYYFQYVVGLAPCDLCLLQRYPHMVAIVAGLAAVACFKVRQVAFFLALIAIAALFVTSGLGVFHFGVEHHWWQGPQECSGRIPSGLSTAELRKFLFSAKMIRCDEPAWSMWGISMAGWNAILSAAAAIVLATQVSRHIHEPTLEPVSSKPAP